MEHVLAGHGIPRRRFEAPHEYLGRVLADLTHGGRGAARLTELFERARFSEHAIGLPLKAEAIDAVEELQAELAAAELERKALVEAA
jgi:predicted Zn-dependent protease